MSHSGQLWRIFCSQHQWPTLSHNCGETTWPLQGTSVDRLWTSLMWCKNCRVSVTLLRRCLTDKTVSPSEQTFSPPALLHSNIVLIQWLGCMPIWSLPAFARQDAHTHTLTHPHQHTFTHIRAFRHTVRKCIVKIKLFTLLLTRIMLMVCPSS